MGKTNTQLGKTAVLWLWRSRLMLDMSVILELPTLFVLNYCSAFCDVDTNQMNKLKQTL